MHFPIFPTLLLAILASGADAASGPKPTTPDSGSFSLFKFAEEVLSTVWVASCKTSKILRRSKRSVEISEWDVPEDTNDLFNYLYPSIQLDHTHFAPPPKDNFTGRSGGNEGHDQTPPGIFALTSWIDDAIDLWTSECVGSAAKNDVDVVHDSLKNMTRATGIIDFFNSTGVFSKKENQNFFVSYGGDIEYFYPVWGWGIPFDNEITFLGFHGFQGIFPYKK